MGDAEAGQFWARHRVQEAFVGKLKSSHVNKKQRLLGAGGGASLRSLLDNSSNGNLEINLKFQQTPENGESFVSCSTG